MNEDHLATSGGLHTHYTEQGEGEPLIALHGFSGSTATMEDLSRRLAERHHVLAVDLVGHGFSEKPADAGRYTMEAAVAQVVGLAAERGVTPFHLVGYSMGARVGLAVALAAPEHVRSLTMISGTAGISDPATRAERIRSDEALAAQIEEKGMEWFADEWMQRPFFSTQHRLGPEHVARARAQRIANEPRAMANSLRSMGAGAQPSYWHILPHLAVPLLFIAGEDDHKFLAIGEQMVAAVPEGMLAMVPGVGHAAHVEAPQDTADVIEHFLGRRHGGPFD